MMLQIYARQMILGSNSNMSECRFSNTNWSLRVTQASFHFNCGPQQKKFPFTVQNVIYPWNATIMVETIAGLLLDCTWIGFCALLCPIIIKSVFLFEFFGKKSTNLKHDIKVIFAVTTQREAYFFLQSFQRLPHNNATTCFLWNTITFCSLF